MLQQHIPLDRARRVLELDENASPGDLRAAYLAKVQQHPPDRDPERFQEIRDAYAKLRQGEQTEQDLLHADPEAISFTAFAKRLPQRCHLGADAWLKVMQRNKW